MPDVRLVPVDAGDPRLGRLLQLYIHEWSARIPLAIGDDGLFAYPDLDHYRDDSTHEAYLIVGADDGALLGFALVMRDDAACWHVEELFILAGVRRRRLGSVAARALIAIHPGPWTFTVRPEHPAALGFWRATFADADVTPEPGADGITRTRFRFLSR